MKHFYGANGEYKANYWCKNCFNQYIYNRNVEKKKMFVRHLGDKCDKCGIEHNGRNTVIFDFHHKVPSTKDADWTRMRKWGLDRIRNEIAKCLLLCSNCHRLVHSTGHKRK